MNLKQQFDDLCLETTWDIYNPLTWVFSTCASPSEVTFATVYSFYVSLPFFGCYAPENPVVLVVLPIDPIDSMGDIHMPEGAIEDLRSTILRLYWKMRESGGWAKTT